MVSNLTNILPERIIVKMNIKSLDALWRKIVMKKHGNRSLYSGLLATEVHHIITRGRRNTRWDIDNGCPLTVEEHRCLHNNSTFKKLVYCRIGQAKIDNLQRKSVQYFDKDFERIEKELKQWGN